MNRIRVVKFASRTDAGKKLGVAVRSRLRDCDGDSLLVLGIPTGGIPVGLEVAEALQAPFDVWLAQKVSAPDNPEFAIGSVASNGEIFIDDGLVAALRIPQTYLDAEIARCRRELGEKMRFFRGSDEPVNVRDKVVILVDDGIATGATAQAALASLQRAGARQRILAVPVAAAATVERLAGLADEMVILMAPRNFSAVGEFYDDFSQLSRQEAAAKMLQKS